MERFKKAIQERRAKGRGRRVWFPLAIVVIAVLFWVTGRAQEPRADGFGHGGSRSLGELAEQLRDHAGWVAGGDLTEADIQRIADVVGARSPAFDALQRRRTELEARVVTTLNTPTVDPQSLLTLQDDATRLASETIDESFLLFAQVVEGLTPEQRTALFERWQEHR